MKLRNIMIVVKDLQKAKRFYTELFGLSVLTEVEHNMILTEGLVFQDSEIWEQTMSGSLIPKSNMCELYFECEDIDAFLEKLYRLYPQIEIVTPLYEYPWGKRIIRFYDLDGNLIEVGTDKKNSRKKVVAFQKK